MKRLIFRMLHLLDTLETPENQPRVQQIRGLIAEILDRLERINDN